MDYLAETLCKHNVPQMCSYSWCIIQSLMQVGTHTEHLHIFRQLKKSLHTLLVSTCSLNTSSKYTHKTSETLPVDLSWDHFNSCLQAKTHIWPQKQQFGYVGFQKKNSTQPYPKMSPVSESSTHPLQNWVCFSHSPLGQGAMPTKLLPLIAPRIEPSYMHACTHPQKYAGQFQPSRGLVLKSIWPAFRRSFTFKSCMALFYSTLTNLVSKQNKHPMYKLSIIKAWAAH